MFRKFKVKPMFKDQYHQRYQFSLTIEESMYQGIFKDEKIQWFHPIPHCKLETKLIQEVESTVNDLLTQQLEELLPRS